jgi:16S rRNA (guanine527-N7)-methyltransferase
MPSRWEVPTDVSRETIATALADLQLGDSVSDKLAAHWELLCQWNRHTNLTSIDSIEEAAWLHYRDSLEALPHLPPGSVMDVGSGGGFPGIPLAIAAPERQVMLVEPRRKRASFLLAAIGRLGLSNSTVVEARAEDVTSRASAVVTRATFSDPAELQLCLERVEPGGRLIAYRGEDDVDADEVHWYELRGQRRCLLLWQR